MSCFIMALLIAIIVIIVILGSGVEIGQDGGKVGPGSVMTARFAARITASGGHLKNIIYLSLHKKDQDRSDH